ncbi:MAG TPA: glycoside hydrolase family 28 protein [Bryobacteraceae bacterium]|jgi:hypothetical protein
MYRRDIFTLGGAAALAARGATRSPHPSSDHLFDVRTYGAQGDGKTNDTAAIQKAIDACTLSGGGTVYIAPGTYHCGTLVLKSNVNFHLESGATILGSKDLADYTPLANQTGPKLKGDANAKHLIFARDAENLTISGNGRIDGQGASFWVPSERKVPPPEDAWKDVATYDWKPLDRASPMVELFNCKNARVEDVTFANASGWTFRPIECDTLVIRGLKIRNPVIGPNTDGIDLTCCRNVSISDCDIATGDDAICLKSEGPYGVMGLSRNITITNCVLTCCCNGLKFGTATHGGYENITFTNSIIHNDDVPLNARVIAGIAIEMVDGGWVDGVVISNVRMQRVRTPIFLRLGARTRSDKPSYLRGVMIDNVHATGAILTSSLTGIPGAAVEDVTLSNIRIETAEAGKREWVDRKIPEQIPAYPEARMFGRLSSYGFYCRHVHRIAMDNVRITSTKSDERPALHFEDVQGLRLDQLACDVPASDQPLMRLVDVRDSLITGCVAPPKTKVAIEVRGADAKGIRLLANDFSEARQSFSAPEGAVLAGSNLNPVS